MDNIDYFVKYVLSDKELVDKTSKELEESYLKKVEITSRVCDVFYKFNEIEYYTKTNEPIQMGLLGAIRVASLLSGEFNMKFSLDGLYEIFGEMVGYSKNQFRTSVDSISDYLNKIL